MLLITYVRLYLPDYHNIKKEVLQFQHEQWNKEGGYTSCTQSSSLNYYPGIRYGDDEVHECSPSHLNTMLVYVWLLNVWLVCL